MWTKETEKPRPFKSLCLFITLLHRAALAYTTSYATAHHAIINEKLS